VIESLLLAVTRVGAMRGGTRLSGATGFFFDRDGRLFLVTNRHVVLDEAGNHRPDRLAIELHVDPENAAQTVELSLPLYRGEAPLWRQAADRAGTVDVVAVEIDRSALPETLLFHAFTTAHLVAELDRVEVGTSVLIVGFPLGFHDTLHHLPVARQAVVASAFGIRFQGNGYFLTDARMHRGTSGAPVVARAATDNGGRRELTWLLLGVHSARLEVPERDVEQDERLDLNCAWYADVLLTLTEDPGPPAAPPA
jgi:S1-C subfamily serine protease